MNKNIFNRNNNVTIINLRFCIDNIVNLVIFGIEKQN